MREEAERPGERPTNRTDRSANRTSGEVPARTADVPSRDAVLRALANRRRRYVLHRLETSRAPMTVADLADDLVRWETDAEPTAVQDERERIYVSLYHCHLPKLADADLVTFDTDAKLVRFREDAAQFPLDASK